MRRLALDDPWLWGLGVGGLANLANGAWMLADPAGWYTGLPAAVPDTGPFNSHFVRDVGGAYAVMGGALVLGALQPSLRPATIGVVALFYVLHALVHVTDTLAGRLPAAHWGIDFPGVYLPALVLVAVTVLAVRARRP